MSEVRTNIRWLFLYEPAFILKEFSKIIVIHNALPVSRLNTSSR
jgi:hypothetical protein